MYDVAIFIAACLVVEVIGMIISGVLKARRVKKSKHNALSRKKDLIKQSDEAQKEQYMAELRFIERYGE